MRSWQLDKKTKETDTYTLSEWFSKPRVGPPVLVLDGGVGSYLEELQRQRSKGNNAGDSPRNVINIHQSELYSSSLLLTSEGKEDIKECHNAYFMAGAQIITTLTQNLHFGTHAQGWACPENVSDPYMMTLLQEGVLLARSSVKEKKKELEQEQGLELLKQLPFIAASSGCYGSGMGDGSEFSGYYPDTTLDDLVEFHERKLKILSGCRPDVIAFEMVPNVLEVKAILQILQERRKNNPVVDGKNNTPCFISLACKNKSQLNNGSPIERVLDLLAEIDPFGKIVQGLGLTCCDVSFLKELTDRVLAHDQFRKGRRALILYPNSTEAWPSDAENWRDAESQTSEEMANALIECVESIRNDEGPPIKVIVGGCYRTSPTTVNAIRTKVHKVILDDDNYVSPAEKIIQRQAVLELKQQVSKEQELKSVTSYDTAGTNQSSSSQQMKSPSRRHRLQRLRSKAKAKAQSAA